MAPQRCARIKYARTGFPRSSRLREPPRAVRFYNCNRQSTLSDRQNPPGRAQETRLAAVKELGNVGKGEESLPGVGRSAGRETEPTAARAGRPPRLPASPPRASGPAPSTPPAAGWVAERASTQRQCPRRRVGARPARGGFTIDTRGSVYLCVRAAQRRPPRLDLTGPVRPPVSAAPHPAHAAASATRSHPQVTDPRHHGGLLLASSPREGLLGEAEAHPRSQGRRVLEGVGSCTAELKGQGTRGTAQEEAFRGWDQVRLQRRDAHRSFGSRVPRPPFASAPGLGAPLLP